MNCLERNKSNKILEIFVSREDNEYKEEIVMWRKRDDIDSKNLSKINKRVWIIRKINW